MPLTGSAFGWMVSFRMRSLGERTVVMMSVTTTPLSLRGLICRSIASTLFWLIANAKPSAEAVGCPGLVSFSDASRALSLRLRVA